MMVRITTTLRIILCGILLTAALSGCCQAVPVPTRSITLRFGYFTFLSSNSAVNDAVTKGFQDAADAYTAEHPNVTVELVPLNFGSLESLSAADFDLVLLPSVFMGRLAEAGNGSGKPQADRAGVDVGFVAGVVGTIAEQLGRTIEFDVNLQSDNRFKFHDYLPPWRALRRYSPKARRRASPSLGPASCRPGVIAPAPGGRYRVGWPVTLAKAV